MLQINEDTHNKQPIMFTFDKPIINKNIDKLTLILPTLSNTNDNHHQQYEHGILFIESLSDENALILISDCVNLIRMPVDPDTIHALLRFILRLTRH
ncbi:unnamed protein product [Rotaria sp. Silwood1]|nr:unnamed protein product [Rotaria sp. Silwood1]